MKPSRAFLFALCIGIALVFPVAFSAEPPPPPPGSADAEPEITIIQRDDAIIEEYRAGGQLYMIKVTPRKGIPYYLVDTDGDGRLDSRRSELAEDLLVPSWILFRW